MKGRKMFCHVIRSSLVACLTLVAVTAAAAPGADDAQAKGNAQQDAEPSVWMKKKLEYSQNILSGLATADFDQIATNAQAMQGLSRIESFVRARTPGYRKQLDAFMEANAEVIRQAQDDNIEGATLAFTQMTISCVQCHKELRKQMVEQPRPKR